MEFIYFLCSYFAGIIGEKSMVNGTGYLITGQGAEIKMVSHLHI